jgi:hypothetical protein
MTTNELERTPGEVAVSGAYGCNNGGGAIPAPAPTLKERLLILVTFYADADPRVILCAWRKAGSPPLDLGHGHNITDLKEWLASLTLENVAMGEWSCIYNLGELYKTTRKFTKPEAPGAPRHKLAWDGVGEDAPFAPEHWAARVCRIRGEA